MWKRRSILSELTSFVLYCCALVLFFMLIAGAAKDWRAGLQKLHNGAAFGSK